LKCQEYRRLLHPYLDSELEVTESLRVLEHLNVCGSCGRLFDAEERAWNRVRDVIRSEVAPAALRQEIPALLWREDRRAFWRRASTYLLPLGMAAAFLIYTMTPSPSGNPPGDPPTPEARPHAHGAAIDFTVAHFLNVQADAGSGGLITDRMLEKHAEFRRLDAKEARRVYRELLGPNAAVPPSLKCNRIQGAVSNTDFNGTPVPVLLLDLNEQEQYSLYVLNRTDADLSNLHLMPGDGVTEDLRIERCRSCYVIGVTKGEKVFILVTRPGASVDPMISLVRRTF
jgi:hypothetical protein